MTLARQSKQTGTTTITAGNTATASISAVTLSKAKVIATYKCDSASPNESSVVAKFTSTTGLEFSIPAGISTFTVSIKWTVYEYTSASNVNIQHVSTTSVTDGSTTTISSTSTSNTFILTGTRTAGGTWGGDDIAVADLTAATTITWRVQTGAPAVQESQVIEFDDASVQKVTTSATTATTINQTISSVTTGRSFAVGHTKYDIGGNFTNLSTTEITSATNVQHVRTGTASGDFYTYVVELPTGWATSFGSVDISASSSSGNITVSTSDTAKTWILPGNSQQLSAGRTSETGDDCGNAFFDFDLTTTTNIAVSRTDAGTPTATLKAWAIEETGAGPSVTPIPPSLHKLDNQFATIIAHRLGGMLQ